VALLARRGSHGGSGGALFAKEKERERKKVTAKKGKAKDKGRSLTEALWGKKGEETSEHEERKERVIGVMKKRENTKGGSGKLVAAICENAWRMNMDGGEAKEKGVLGS